MKKHVHFIGICGKAMAPIAKMFLDLGWKVSGSDKGFFPPMSDYLRQFPEIDFYPGFHPERIEKPDLVVVGTIGPSNPELQYIKNENIPYEYFPEILAEYVKKKNSIVVVGTYGKSTITSLIAWILETAEFNPSFMSGGMQQVFPDGVCVTNSEWSVIEGDEYPYDLQNPRSKFFHYHPKYLVLTGITWDHSDVFKTEKSFIEPFIELVSSIPSDGLIVANKNGENIEQALKHASCRIVYYNNEEGYAFKSIKQRTPTRLSVINRKQSWCIGLSTELIGMHMLENLLAAVTLVHELGIYNKYIAQAVKTFKTVKQRLEVRGLTKQGAVVIDDLAHSPVKVQASIRAISEWFPESRIVVVFEPNLGNRTLEAADMYHHAFDQADKVIIPRLSPVKKTSGEMRLSGELISDIISKTQRSVTYIEKDGQIIDYLKQNTHKGDVIAFMGSHGFRGMIDELLTG